MTLIIDVPAEIETKLETAARKSGVSKNELARIILEEKLTNGEKKRLPDNSRIVAVDLPVRDRSREREWLEKNCDEYDGLYVALDGDKLIAQGTGFKEVSLKVRELGIKDALITLVEGRHRPLFISGSVW